MIGDRCTGKTHLIDLLATRRISDPLLPSFEYVSESDCRTEIGVITLRLLELRRYHMHSPEIMQVCKAAKHVFLFVFSHGNLRSLCGLNYDWIFHVREIFGWTIATVMLENKIDIECDLPRYALGALERCRREFYVDYAFECSALTGDRVEAVFHEIAMFGNETRPFRKPLPWKDYIKRIPSPDYGPGALSRYRRQFDVDDAFVCSALTGDRVEAVFYEIASFGNETRPLRTFVEWQDRKIVIISKKHT
ncbi:hypothetical protein CEXT_502791 [Caerostris extrusa]|uniref:Uncharacterized protein n=1 Tax=Caerostris extrusa TaxID=172846 RepID=A0AAV4MGV5_CAEEX|nr:hypothetical protein CEXT_502791 [Caerostris extrusa]